MADRINGVYVALDKDYRDDDVPRIIEAIEMLKGVIRVEPHVVNMDSWIAEQRARADLEKKLIEVLYPEKEKK